jgi:hypothetical protein
MATIHHHSQNPGSQELTEDVTGEEEEDDDVYTEIPSDLRRYKKTQ